MTAQKSNSSTVWFNVETYVIFSINLVSQVTLRSTVRFNFQTYIIYSINLVSQVTLRSSGTDIFNGCHLLRCLYNLLFFL